MEYGAMEFRGAPGVMEQLQRVLADSIAQQLEGYGHAHAEAQLLATVALERLNTALQVRDEPGTEFARMTPSDLGTLWEELRAAGAGRLLLDIRPASDPAAAERGEIAVNVVEVERRSEWGAGDFIEDSAFELHLRREELLARLSQTN
ncbi:MAG: hypothetical protein Q4C67_05340 [Deinococcus sp.]|nr:hypothetical protein [Deinococcus sp.]